MTAPKLRAVSPRRREALPALLKRLREEAGLSMGQVEDQSQGGVGKSSVSAIEGGKQHPSPRTLDVLAAVYGVDPGELRALAGQRLDRGSFVLPDRASQLSQRERRVVLGMVDALLAARDGDQ